MKIKINISLFLIAIIFIHSCMPNENKIDIIELTFFDSKKNIEISFLINLQREYLLISNAEIEIKPPPSQYEISNPNEFSEANKLESEIIFLNKNNIKLLNENIYDFTQEDFISKINNSLDGGAFIINIIYSNMDYKNIKRVNDFTENQTKLFYEILKIVSKNSSDKNNQMFINDQLDKFDND